MLRKADGVGGVKFSRKKCYEGVSFNEGMGGGPISMKKGVT